MICLFDKYKSIHYVFQRIIIRWSCFTVIKFLYKGVQIKTIIIGLGNTLLSDDGAGIYVAEECRKIPQCKDVTIVDGGLDGVTLLALLSEHDRAIIVDAVRTGEQKAGYIFRTSPEALNKALYPRTTHGIDLITALELGKKLEQPMPGEIIIFAIEVADITTMSETCTPDVQKAIPVCSEMIIRELNKSL